MARSNKQPIKIALVCDWLTSIGGAERVVLALHQMFPDAPIYTSQYNPKKNDWFADADVRTTWLQLLPKNNTFRKFLPILRRIAFERLDLREFDLIISSSGAEAKAINKINPQAIHINYCHSPTHYYWSRYDAYMDHPGFGIFNPLARLGLKILAGPMRRWDYKVAQRPDYIIANSTHIKNKIQEYYDRESTVIHPPVDTMRFAQGSDKHDRYAYVIAGRQVPYKRFDLAIAACNKLKLPLYVIGDGPEHQNLVKLGGDTIQFHKDITDDQMPRFFANAKTFVFPGIEDFGITPVEALAAGTPVIALKAGGALDYVRDGQSGVLFEDQTVDSLCEAIKRFENMNFDHSKISKDAKQFDTSNFKKSVQKFIDKAIKSSRE